MKQIQFKVLQLRLCDFHQNYSRPSVMALAVPVAVRFLQRGNRELSRNMSSYLSLAAIAEADLLAEHTEAITLSVLAGRRSSSSLFSCSQVR